MGLMFPIQRTQALREQWQEEVAAQIEGTMVI